MLTHGGPFLSPSVALGLDPRVHAAAGSVIARQHFGGTVMDARVTPEHDG